MATHNLDLPDDLLRALGRLTVEWAYLEMLVRAMVDDLLGKDDPSDRWTGATRPISQRIRDLQKGDAPDAIMSVCRQLDEIATKRNLLVHGVWARRLSTGETIQVIDSAGEREVRSITSGDVAQLAAQVTDLSKQLSLLRLERHPRNGA